MLQRKGCITERNKESLLIRIKKIQGQVQGLEKMIHANRYCVDILMQISSVHEALRGFGKEIMHDYLKRCVSKSILSKRKEKQEAIYRELMDVIYKYAK
ncbi:MAG: transcriptional regulator [Candidatus Cloacimonadota bacterium]|nr:MAG: transcriptional regulator [Candidatus Cloacimonadota bacterium]